VSDILKKCRLNWKMTTSSTADNAGISRRYDTRYRRMQELNRLQCVFHRQIAGDVPTYLIFALKVAHSFRKRRFRHISFNNASAVRVSEKVQLLLIGSGQCAFHRAIDHSGALLFTPKSPKSGSKRQFFLHIFALPSISSLHIIADNSNWYAD